MYFRDSEQLDAVVEAVRMTLGTSVIAIYQYGSALVGGLRPSSDLDVLVVVDTSTTARQRRDLVAELLQVSGRRGTRIAGRPVEVTVVRHEFVNRWRNRPQREFQYGEWLRDEYEAGHVPEPAVDADLAPLLATVLGGSHPLLGPPAAELIDRVPREDLVSSMWETIPSLIAELSDDARNVLLTLARIWYTTSTGAIVAKDVAAGWALQRMPPDLVPALAHARAVYLGIEEESFGRFPDGGARTARYLAGAALHPACE